MSGLARIVASCLGIGRLRPAPGTIGSAFALGLFALLLAGRPLAVQLIAVLIAAGVGIVTAGVTARALGQEDPSEVVIDELAGMWIALLGSSTLGYQTAGAWLLAFLAFRAFDIAKPFPVGRLEALPGGWGVVCDDLAAGAYALGVVTAARAMGLVA